jgi:hypothetical protein
LFRIAVLFIALVSICFGPANANMIYIALAALLAAAGDYDNCGNKGALVLIRGGLTLPVAG